MLNLFRKIFHRGDMNCMEVRQLSSDYIEEELPPAKQSSVRAHLNRCGPCKAFVDTLAATIGTLARLPRMPAPPTIKQSILERTSGYGDRKNAEPDT